MLRMFAVFWNERRIQMNKGANDDDSDSEYFCQQNLVSVLSVCHSLASEAMITALIASTKLLDVELWARTRGLGAKPPRWHRQPLKRE